MCAEESRPSEPDPDKRALQDARFQTQHVTWQGYERRCRRRDIRIRGEVKACELQHMGSYMCHPAQAKGIRMVSKEEPEEGTPNAEADILGPAQSEDDCESVL